MTAVWILLGLLALLLVVALIPCRVKLQYLGGKFEASFHYLFIRIPLTGRKKKPQKQGKKPDTEKEAKPEKKKKSSAHSFMDYLELLNDLLPLLNEQMRKGAGHIVLKKCRILLIVAQEDAAATAIRFGRANLLLYNIYAFLSHYIVIREFRPDIRQDYLGGPQAERAEADLLFAFRLLGLMLGGGRLLWRGGRIALDFKNKKPLPSTKGSE